MDEENDSGIGLGAVVGGIGAAALAIPNIRKKALKGIKALFKEEAPPRKNPNLELLDESERVSTLPKVQQTREMTRLNELMQKEREELEEIRKQVMKKPLTFGGQTKRVVDPVNNPGDFNFGSATYDFIALHPSNKPLKADQWIQEFAKPGLSTKYKTPGFQNVNANVTREELEDLNLAVFDGNKLVGGFLKSAKDADISIDKKTLLNIAENSPMRDLKVNILGPRYQATEVVDEAVTLARKKFEAGIDYFDKKLPALTSDMDKDLQKAFKKEFIQKSTQGYGKLSDFKADFNLKIRQQGSANLADLPFRQTRDEFAEQLIKTADGPLEFLKSPSYGTPEGIKKRTAAVNTYLQTIAQKFDDTIKSAATAVNNLKSPGKVGETSFPRTKYSGQDTYRLRGAENYNEVIVQFKPRNRLGEAARSTAHYEDYSGVQDEQLYFFRFGTRSDFDNFNSKIYSIDEIQSDLTKSLKQIALREKKEGKKFVRPVNRFNTDFSSSLASARTKQLVERANDLADKGVNMSMKERQELRELNSKVKTLFRSAQSGAPSDLLKIIQSSSDTNKYMPLSNREQYGEHAVKILAKKALNDGVDFISVNPSNVQHNLKQGVKVGNQEFYGDIADKRKGEVVKAMERLARQYGSQVQLRRVSLSDPKKPFKVLSNVIMEKPTDGVKMSREHIAAFERELDAKMFAQKIGASAERDIKFIEGTNPENYFDAYTLRITPEMGNKPFKIYKKLGGLVVDIFKW